jgi:hypothetical protein
MLSGGSQVNQSSYLALGAIVFLLVMVAFTFYALGRSHDKRPGRPATAPREAEIASPDRLSARLYSEAEYRLRPMGSLQWVPESDRELARLLVKAAGIVSLVEDASDGIVGDVFLAASDSDYAQIFWEHVPSDLKLGDTVRVLRMVNNHAA